MKLIPKFQKGKKAAKELGKQVRKDLPKVEKWMTEQLDNVKNSEEYKRLMEDLGEGYEWFADQIIKGRDIYRKWINGPTALKRASKDMSVEDAREMYNWQSSTLDFDKVPEYREAVIQIGPFSEQRLKVKPEIPKKEDALGASVVEKNGERTLYLDPNITRFWDIIHEAGHASNLNWKNTFRHASEYPRPPQRVQSAVEKQMENAKRLANQLEVDPVKYEANIKYQMDKGLSYKEAKEKIDKYIAYAKDPQEVRARGISANAWMENNPIPDDPGYNIAVKLKESPEEYNKFIQELINNGHTPSEAKTLLDSTIDINLRNGPKDYSVIPLEVDDGVNIFTGRTLGPIYKDIYGLGIPIIGGSLYETQD